MNSPFVDLPRQAVDRQHLTDRRVEPRLGEVIFDDDQPFVLELNPNPDFAPDRALANNLWAGGIEHGEFVQQLVRNALARRGVASGARYLPRAAS